MIEVAKDRIVRRSGGTTEIETEDVVGKIEITPNEERYENGFTDYHK